jgi:hypothetical protein
MTHVLYQKRSDKVLTFHSDIDIETIARYIVDDLPVDDIEWFVLRIDELMENYDFSVNLLRKLAESLEGDGVKVTIEETEMEM